MDKENMRNLFNNIAGNTSGFLFIKDVKNLTKELGQNQHVPVEVLMVL